MNKFIVFFLISLVASDVDIDVLLFQEFKKFITKYDKKYSSVKEYLARFEVFKRNVITNLKEESSYEIGITKFSDLTFQEFSKNYLNLDYDALDAYNFHPITLTETIGAPSAWDWRQKGYVGAVKNQGNCQGCWSFATAANLEGQYFKKKKSFVALSEQMLIDCDYLNKGCTGGNMDKSFAFLQINGGIMKEADYPFEQKTGTCRSVRSKYVDMKVTSYKRLDSTDENQIKEFLYQTGPLAIALNGDPLQSYKSGIIDKTSAQCSPDKMNHAVTLVGYGHDNASNKDYWIIKNSYGTNWGEKGYFRIKRGSGTCGVNKHISTAYIS